METLMQSDGNWLALHQILLVFAALSARFLAIYAMKCTSQRKER
jgi:hypothetical protein